jgi:polyisoprenoid-binding protein YceI
MTTRIQAKLRLLAFAFAATTLAAGVARADASDWNVKKDESNVTFQATGKPGFLKINGEGAHVAGTAHLADGKVSGEFDVVIDELKTGIDLRDEHMKEKYLKAKEFPKAHLVLDKAAVAPKGKTTVPFTGKLTLKGVEKPVEGELTVDLDEASAKGQATFDLKLSDFAIDIPVYLGVTVAEKVAVAVDFVADKAKSVALKP